jgi:hypothetical protein
MQNALEVAMGRLSKPPHKPPKQSTESEYGRVRAAPEAIPHPELLIGVVLVGHYPLPSLIHVAAPTDPNLLNPKRDA